MNEFMGQRVVWWFQIKDILDKHTIENAKELSERLNDKHGIIYAELKAENMVLRAKIETIAETIKDNK